MSKRPTLTEDDFTFEYVNIRKYPKLVHWVTMEPLTFGAMQVTVTVLQRQMTPDDDEEFIATVKPTSNAVSTSGDSYESDPYSEGGLMTDTCYDFEDACEEALDIVEELLEKHDLA